MAFEDLVCLGEKNLFVIVRFILNYIVNYFRFTGSIFGQFITDRYLLIVEWTFDQLTHSRELV